MMTKKALFHDPFVTNRNVRVEGGLHFCGPQRFSPVEKFAGIGASVDAISAADASIVDLTDNSL
jgi:hypothetical protein